MGRPPGLPPALFPLSVRLHASRLARFARLGVLSLLCLLFLWLVHHQVLNLGVAEPFLYLALGLGVCLLCRTEREPQQLEVDAAGNFFITFDQRRWRFSPDSMDACYAAWIHMRGTLWSDASLDGQQPEGPPRRAAFSCWRDSMSRRDWQRLTVAVSWLQQRGEPLLGALSARTTKAGVDEG